MTTTLSVRIDISTKKRLEMLARRARRSKSFLAAEAIAAFVETESWQLDEIQAGLEEHLFGLSVSLEGFVAFECQHGYRRPLRQLRFELDASVDDFP